MIDLSKYKNVIYDDKDYNCLHFAVDLWQDLKNQSLDMYVVELMTGRNQRKINPDKLRQFTALLTPHSPCMAVMRHQEPHAGVYHDGLIYHLSEDGIKAQPPQIIKMKYGRISYYDLQN